MRFWTPNNRGYYYLRLQSDHKNNKDFRGEDIRKIARSVLVDVLSGSEGRLEEKTRFISQKSFV